jgi:hypothetical protein
VARHSEQVDRRSASKVDEEAELRELRRTARRNKVTVAAWVRRALRAARRSEPTRDADRKLAVVRAAVRRDFPVGEIGQMLSEIERGYLNGPHT